MEIESQGHCRGGAFEEAIARRIRSYCKRYPDRCVEGAFRDAVRWATGYLWASGPSLVDRELAEIERCARRLAEDLCSSCIDTG